MKIHTLSSKVPGFRFDAIQERDGITIAAAAAATAALLVPTPYLAARSASAGLTAAVGASAMVRSWGSVVCDIRGRQPRDGVALATGAAAA